MELSNILSSLVYYAFKAPVVTGLTQWVTWFITLFSSVGVGVIVFTIVLKLITFPLDYASRASMRKNSVKMEYAIALIAEKEKLTLTAKEYEEGVAEQAMQQGYEDVEAFEKEVGRETIELMLLQPKVGKFLLDNCKIVEATE